MTDIDPTKWQEPLNSGDAYFDKPLGEWPSAELRALLERATRELAEWEQQDRINPQGNSTT